MATVLIFIAVLALLVLTHEFGHFIVARICGVRVYEFGFGFAPCLASYAKINGRWHWRVGKIRDDEAEGTVYTVNLLPLGGFVRLKGENINDTGANDKDSFQNKPAMARVGIIVAGVVMNVLLAWVMLSIIFMVGMPEPVPSAKDIPAKVSHYIQVLGVQTGSAADEAKIVDGDEIIGVDGLTSPSTDEFKNYIKTKAATDVYLNVRRGSNVEKIKVTPKLDATSKQALIGVGIVDIVVNKYNFFSALGHGFTTALDYMRQILYGFWQLIHSAFGGPSVEGEVAGPVGVAVMTGRAARLGFLYLVHFSAVLSLNLAILNVLPVPALDGGRLLFIVINSLKKKPVAAHIEHMVHNISFLLLIILILGVTAKDLYVLISPWLHRVF